ncbi:lipopolysaccharide biosynthesis protein [Pontibacter sp. SGAir0037]|uniref:lipopolysaccharide biosynthesis protein n=1 Tax=Pontibacter sp. SGAir0037 TaxID=2571030 RepID=UPI0010CCDA0D|nr:lipopolysaccharide biosynthesis protein [Pontibacter sp. SGAir0037]QCR22812.1 hypothetical protein C1N53_10975 [Pontibacter sp. SGAir0037]
MSKNLASKAVNGLKWGTASTVANAVMQIGCNAVMARLLDPGAFGLIAGAQVVLRFGSYFANFGLTKAIIQKEHLTEENVRAAFTSSFLLGLVFTVISYLLAPFATLIVDNPDVIPLVKVMALSFLISGVSTTAVSLLERDMHFKTLSILETVSYIISYLGVGLTMGYLGFGVWSLVCASLLQVGIVAIGAYAVIRHNVVLLFVWEHYKALFGYGSRMSVISFLEFLNQEIGTILIGRTLGTHRLGIYNRSYMLVNLPMYQLTRILMKVTFPSFSKLQADTKKLAKVYLSSITLLAAIIIPMCLGILVASPEIIAIMLGDQWMEAVPVMQVLSLAIPLSFITMFAGIVCDAKAVLNPKIVLTVIFIVMICFFFYLLRGYGLVGFAAAIFLGELVRIILYQRLMNRVLEISYRQQISIYMPGLINGIVIAVAMYLVSTMMRGADLPLWLILGAQIAIGGILLGTLTLLFPHKLLRSEIQAILTRFGIADKTDTYYSKIIHKYRNYILKGA